MAKDPAVLWYFNDWAGGTATLSRFLKGCYMDLLYAQFNTGHLSLDEIKTVLGSDFGSSWPALQKKFVKDDKGLYYNQRLLFETDKRKSYTKSRRQNLMGDHMENATVIKNGIKEGGLGETEQYNRLQEFGETCLTRQIWSETFCMTTGANIEDLPKIIIDFNAHVISMGKGQSIPDLEEYQSYLTRWKLNKKSISVKGHKAETPTSIGELKTIR